MKKLILAVVALALLFGVRLAYAAPQSNIFRNILPETTQQYDNGTSTAAWLHVEAQQFCLTGASCISTWPTGGSGGGGSSTIAGLSPSNGVFTLATSSAGTTFTFSTTSPGTITFTSPANLLSTTTAASTYYLQSNPSGYITPSALTPYLSTTTAAATYQLEGNYITGLTGDGTASGPGSAALTLATVNSNVGTFGSSSSIPQFTVNAKGLVTAASGNTPSLPASDITSGQLAVAQGGTGAATLPTNTFLLGNGTSAVAGSSLSQSGGTTFINGSTPIIDGGGDWINNVIQTSASNAIIQTNPNALTVVGGFIQNGGVTTYNTSTSVPASVFCNGGGAIVIATSTAGNITLTLPTLSQIQNQFCSNSGTTLGNTVYAGSLAQQVIFNFSNFTATVVPSATNESIASTPGSSASIPSGQQQTVWGSFINNLATDKASLLLAQAL